MKYICHDCGYEIPDGMDFCPRCGCVKDKSTPVDDQTGMPLGICPHCGASTNPGDAFCGSCGSPLPEVRMMVPKMRKNGMIAIILAMFPGFFNVFGLGHLVLKDWSKGAMFLAMSVILFYINGGFMPTTMLMSILSIAVYFYQCMDLIRVVYSPEVH